MSNRTTHKLKSQNEGYQQLVARQTKALEELRVVLSNHEVARAIEADRLQASQARVNELEATVIQLKDRLDADVHSVDPTGPAAAPSGFFPDVQADVEETVGDAEDSEKDSVVLCSEPQKIDGCFGC